MSTICFDGIMLAKRLAETHGDTELGADILASAKQCRSRRDCQHAARCTETMTALAELLIQRAER